MVLVNGVTVDRPAAPVVGPAAVEVTPEGRVLASQPSRAGGKLEAALDHFAVNVAGRVWLDVGAAHGGFTAVLLQRGARRVYALDVGEGQLAPDLRKEPRVVVLDRCNVRHLERDALPERCGGITIDVSFISLLAVVPPVLPHLEPDGWLLALIKPQFEVGAGRVGKGGIVRDDALRQRIFQERCDQLAAMGPGLRCLGWFESPVVGMGGNREAFACFRGDG
jgi:23S rRNA (cytidine1920-2'-O)/16S rRNA (cytidine1409-2'-O)-methyltransferase